MFSKLTKRLSSQTQLNIIGGGALVFLGFGAQQILRAPMGLTLIPLVFVGYAAFRIIYELTINRANVPTLATSYTGRRKIIEILKREASLRSDGVYAVIDLGSGRGGLTRLIARKIPQTQVTGIEFARIPYWQSVWMQKLFGPKNLCYLRCNFLPYDCAQTDAVVFYLSANFAPRVGEKLYRELKNGSMIISYMFPLAAPWKPAEIIQYCAPFKEVIYVYRKL